MKRQGLEPRENLPSPQGRSRETPVIMVSAIADQETARQTLALGAADYVTKPVDFPYLDTVLEVHLFLGEM